MAAATATDAQPADADVELVDVGAGEPAELPAVDELLVYVHGWFGNHAVEEQTATTADALADAGYEADATVALRWDASLFRYGRAEARTEDVGEALARMVERRAAQDVDTGTPTIHLLGHSLGARVVLETLARLATGDASAPVATTATVATVATMGAAADGATVARGGRWYEGIASRADAVRNYHSRRDRVVGFAYGGWGGTALGADGAADPGATPSNYVDVDVTEHVAGHTGYAGNAAVARDLADAIASQGDVTDRN